MTQDVSLLELTMVLTTLRFLRPLTLRAEQYSMPLMLKWNRWSHMLQNSYLLSFGCWNLSAMKDAEKRYKTQLVVVSSFYSIVCTL